MLISPAAAQARNTYRDIFAAVFDYCVREGLLTHSPLAEVNRKSKELERHERITTTEQYMAYRPQPELAGQITSVAARPRFVASAISGILSA